MNILIVNQPLNNRGDEAAHKAFVRALLATFPGNTRIEVLFCQQQRSGIDKIAVLSPRTEYVNISPHKGMWRFWKWCAKHDLKRLPALVDPVIRRIRRHIRQSDLVVCAPGGICMGLFQNWQHILFLQLAQTWGVPVAYYSRSFGPFPRETADNRKFERISAELLGKFDFLSIRDLKTMSFATQMNISFTPAIDTALLETPAAAIPREITEITGEKYIVFVPNSLTWHPAYEHADRTDIDGFYLQIIRLLSEQHPGHRIVMLPQLFNIGRNGDVHYFERLKSASRSDDIVIIPEKYDSDIQQAIIARAELMVGARYHSIVFAVNNRVPFIALSYEHKITGLCQILHVPGRVVDVSRLGTKYFDPETALAQMRSMITDGAADPALLQQTAHGIARACFQTFAERYLK